MHRFYLAADSSAQAEVRCRSEAMRAVRDSAASRDADAMRASSSDAFDLLNPLPRLGSKE